MSVVLGIDAAWTIAEPSGVALVCGAARAWQCLAVAPSYAAFLGLARGDAVDWTARPKAGRPDVAALIGAARKLGGTRALPDVIAVDMPLARTPIVGRREADRAVSRTFGSRGCSVHSPSARRPGPISDRLRADLQDAGVEFVTDRHGRPQSALLEVYPHIALLELLEVDRRVPYKVARSNRYWREERPSRDERIRRLLNEWHKIVDALTHDLGPLPLSFPQAGQVKTLTGLKRWEDALDAVICAWMGARYLDDKATPYGGYNAAIWGP